MPPHLYDYLLPGKNIPPLAFFPTPSTVGRVTPTQNQVPIARPVQLNVSQAGSPSAGNAANAQKAPGKRTHSQATEAGDADKTAAAAIDPKNIPFDESDLDGKPIVFHCNQVRTRIHRVIDNGEMTVKDFCDMLGVSSTSYYGFMQQTGTSKGMGSAVFSKASAYFLKREELGVKLPVKRRKTDEPATKGKGKTSSAIPDVSEIHLDGEEKDAVPVYDTCDMIRRKINEHLKNPSITKKAFLETLLAQYQGPRRPPQISATSLNTFRDKSGGDNGNTSPVFYAAYVYFEKIRIKEGKSKSKDREKMEEIWGKKSSSRPNGGMDIDYNVRQKGFTVHSSSKVTSDKWGRWFIDGECMM